MYNRAMTTYSATDARAALPQILDRVAAGEEVFITRHGIPVAVIVNPRALRTRRDAATLTAADNLLDELRSARGQRAPRRGLSPADADQAVRRLRAERAR
jgi:prevent-host-death family protein